MNFLKRNVWHLLGYGTLFVLFSISVLIRRDDLRTDLGRHHEWITAHALITMEIWDEHGGPSEFGFNPIYTYPEGYNFPRKALGGVTDENGWNYYVSYPPFAFIFGYYATQILGGPDVDSIRTLNLIIHFFCGLFIYLIFLEILSRQGHARFNFSGLIAAGIYFLSTGTLWAHSMLFFVDTVGQLWVIILLYLGLKLFGSTTKYWPLLVGLFIVSFVASYTEWLGIFLAFFGGLVFFILWLKKRKKQFLLAFLVLGLSSSMALVVTVSQYSSIAGWDKLYESSVKKYDERGGHVTDNPQLIHHSGNPETFQMIRRVFDRQYYMAEQLFFYTAIGFLIVLVLPKTRRKMNDALLPSLLIGVPLLAISMHYILFLNFNALHDFSAIKFGFIVSLAIGGICHFLFTVFFDFKIRLGIGAILTTLFIFAATESARKFHEKYPTVSLDQEWLRSCQKIAKLHQTDKAIFIDKPFTPQQSWYFKSDSFRADDTAAVVYFMQKWQIPVAQYFINDGSRLKEMREYAMNDGLVKLTQKASF